MRPSRLSPGSCGLYWLQRTPGRAVGQPTCPVGQMQMAASLLLGPGRAQQATSHHICLPRSRTAPDALLPAAGPIQDSGILQEGRGLGSTALDSHLSMGHTLSVLPSLRPARPLVTLLSYSELRVGQRPRSPLRQMVPCSGLGSAGTWWWGNSRHFPSD